ncbi:MAG: hypothetical protein ACJ8MO_16600 [Bacillus sp. (in: firmicutes)]
MSDTSMIVAGVILLILLVGLFVTLRSGRMVSTSHNELDTQINEKTQSHPYLLNPVFLAYVFFIAVVIIYIVYHAFNYY